MNTETVVFMFGVFWLGMVFGWLAKPPWDGFRAVFFKVFWLFVLTSIVGSFLGFMIMADSIYMTGPFLAGFLVYTWRGFLGVLRGKSN